MKEYVVEGNKIFFERQSYNDGTLRIMVHAFDEEFGCWMPSCVITHHVEATEAFCKDANDVAFLDGNNAKNFIKWIMNNGFAERIGETIISTPVYGGMIYPLVKFKEEFLLGME